jgi:hypothetical protein
MGERRGVILLGLSAICGGFAVFVWLTGGIDTRVAGVAVRSRAWERPATIAAVLAVAGLIAARRSIGSIAPRGLPALPVAAACWTAFASLAFGTFAAGGADSYGYVSQAELFAHGRATDRLPTDPVLESPDRRAALIPLGYTLGRRDSLAPVYPPGLPLLMAPFAAVASRAVFYVVPLCAALTTLIVWRLGVALGEPLAGALAAVLLAFSPIYLYQSMQPMSDVPVTTFWLAALLAARRPARWSPFAAGTLAAVAILIRPNLAPLAAFVVLAAATVESKFDFRRAVLCAALLAPAVVALGAIQYQRYGSALASGYGSFDDLFSLSNVAPNLARYPRWMIELHTPFVWLWLAAPLWIVRAPLRQRRFSWIAYGFAAAVVLAYLPYVYFRPEEWFYTRFLLPALPLMLIFGVAGVRHALERVAAGAAAPVTVMLALTLAIWLARTAVWTGAFTMHEVERKYPDAGAFVRDHAPPTAVVLAMQHSGSIRYYSGRQTIRWDLIERSSLDRTIEAYRASGREPFAVLDGDEDAAFRERFQAGAQVSIAQLALLATVGPTRIYSFR